MTLAQEKRWKAELQIIKELKRVPSCREMQQLLKDEFGITANHNTVNADLKQDLAALTKEEFQNQKMGILKMLDDEIEIAHNIAMHDPDSKIQLDAMNTVSKLSKTKGEVLIKFKRAQAEIMKDEKPKIHVHIGEFTEIDLKKFNKLEGVTEDEKTD